MVALPGATVTAFGVAFRLGIVPSELRAGTEPNSSRLPGSP